MVEELTYELFLELEEKEKDEEYLPHLTAEALAYTSLVQENRVDPVTYVEHVEDVLDHTAELAPDTRSALQEQVDYAQQRWEEARRTGDKEIYGERRQGWTFIGAYLGGSAGAIAGVSSLVNAYYSQETAPAQALVTAFIVLPLLGVAAGGGLLRSTFDDFVDDTFEDVREALEPDANTSPR